MAGQVAVHVLGNLATVRGVLFQPLGVGLADLRRMIPRNRPAGHDGGGDGAEDEPGDHGGVGLAGGELARCTSAPTPMQISAVIAATITSGDW
jgi:hypothetical protein